MDRQELGRRGEELAARFLTERGWRILARNFRSGHKEVDLIARRAGVLAFVEVKTRRGRSFGHPLASITWRKRTEVTAAARGWLRDHPPPPGTIRRFDAVAVHVAPGGTARIEHVEDAWRPGE